MKILPVQDSLEKEDHQFKTIPENAKLWMLKDGLNKDNGDGESVVVSVLNPDTATVEREEDSDSEYLFSSD